MYTDLYRWIALPKETHKKSITQQDQKGYDNSEIIIGKLSERGESKYVVSIFVQYIFDRLFQDTFQIMP